MVKREAAIVTSTERRIPYVCAPYRRICTGYMRSMEHSSVEFRAETYVRIRAVMAGPVMPDFTQLLLLVSCLPGQRSPYHDCQLTLVVHSCCICARRRDVMDELQRSAPRCKNVIYICSSGVHHKLGKALRSHGPLINPSP